MLRGIALLAVVAGCQVALGLDHVEREVTGTWSVKYVYNNASHAPVLDTQPFGSAEQRLELRADDGEVTPIDMESDGSFRFVARGADYRLFATDGGEFRELRHSVPHLEIQTGSLGRPLSLPAPLGTTLRGTISPSGDETHIITTGGVWETFTLGIAGAYSVPWEPKALLSAAEHDRIYFARYEVKGDAAVITAVAVHDTLEMVASTVNTVDQTLQPIPQPYCAVLNVEHAAETARLTQAHPEINGGDDHAWGLYATPDEDLGPITALPIANGRVVCSECTMAYSSPFTGFGTLALMSVRRQLPSKMFPVTRYAATTVFDFMDNSVTCDRHTLASGLTPIPTNLRLNGVPLDTDGMELAVDGSAELTWEVDGPVDMFVVELFEATAAGHGVLVGRTTTLERRMVFDAKQLAAGRPFNVLVRSRIGRPNASKGDLATLTYPFGESFVSGAVFYVKR